MNLLVKCSKVQLGTSIQPLVDKLDYSTNNAIDEKLELSYNIAFGKMQVWVLFGIILVYLLLLSNVIPYASVISNIFHTMVYTCPKILGIVCGSSHFMDNFCNGHLEAIKWF